MKKSRLVGRSWALLGIVASLLILAGACAQEEGGGGPGGQFDGTVKIGTVADFSGPLGRPLDFSRARGTEKGVEDVNAQGGVNVGGKRYRLELVKVDSRSEATAAVAAAQQLIQEKVVGVEVTTCPFSPQVYAQLKEAATAVVWNSCPPILNLLDRDTRFYEGIEKHPLLFATIDFAQPIVSGWFKQIKRVHPTLKRATFLMDDTALGRALAPLVERGAKEVGLEWVPGVHWPAGTTDYSTYVTTVRDKKADIVYTTSPPGGGAELVKQMVELDMAPFLITVGMRPVDVEKAGDLRNKTLIMVDWRTPYHKGIAPKEHAAAAEAFGLLPGGQPPQIGFTVAHYDFVRLLAQAMEKAGTVTDAKAIAKALPGLSRTSVFGGKIVALEDHSVRGPTGNIESTRDKYTVYTYEDARSDKVVTKFDVKRGR